jgi:hypothetical protein
MAWIGTGFGAVRRGLALAACTGFLAAVGGVAAAPPTTDSLPLAAAYGDGVHAYFAGDFQRAYEDLTQAIEAGTEDPRAFYFRGLAALRQGRSDEAEADFSAGADHESRGLGGWPVARSLERIQGAERLQLERHRMRARVANLQRVREAERLRYSQIEAAQPDVLRRRRPVAPRGGDEGNVFEEPNPAERPEPAAPAEPMPAPAAEPEATEPAEPAEPSEPAAKDPFGADAASSSKAEQVEELAAEREDVAAQRDEQQEAEAAEAEDAEAQADQQAEQAAAAGDQ